MQHYVSTSYRISKECHRGISNALNSARQGNSPSGALCRDFSSLIFKYIENVRLVIKAQFLLMQDYFKRMTIIFIDNIDFYSARINSEDEIQKTIKINKIK